MFGFKKKLPKKIYKIDYLTCAHDDEKTIFFKKDFDEYKLVEAVDQAEAIKQFSVYMHNFFITGNIYIKRISEVKLIN